ncbi:MAG TPA: succinate dehydrogenase [Candidatus Polarisedimenticolia bacterium]|nr:succinate dehydrogenase [Candidatus Polarisedimenticolia bacterium]
MSETLRVGAHPVGFAATTRSDRWWMGVLATCLGLTAFILYATWAAFQSGHYWHNPYVSPFASPLLFVKSGAEGAAPAEHAWFGEWPAWWPRFLPASPSLLILVFPLGFRLTCYYFRKAYYRAYTASPPACAVGALPRRDYRGETSLLLFQNLHRYALYFIMIFIAVHYYDTFWSFFRDGRFGVGVGSIVLTMDALLLSLYVFGCHSFRHLIGGRLDCFSCDAVTSVRHGAWRRVSFLNSLHGLFGWLSLFWVAFSDFYVRMVSMGIIRDINTWG